MTLYPPDDLSARAEALVPKLAPLAGLNCVMMALDESGQPGFSGGSLGDFSFQALNPYSLMAVVQGLPNHLLTLALVDVRRRLGTLDLAELWKHTQSFQGMLDLYEAVVRASEE